MTHEHPDIVTAVPPNTSLGSRILLWPIIAYRRWISPALPPRCRFYPSCSEYAMTAIAVHGPVRGIGLGIWRLMRCHPFNPGGIDHVPPRRDEQSHNKTRRDKTRRDRTRRDRNRRDRRRDRSMTSWAG